jgi:hypothetical protein
MVSKNMATEYTNSMHLLLLRTDLPYKLIATYCSSYFTIDEKLRSRTRKDSKSKFRPLKLPVNLSDGLPPATLIKIMIVE